MRIRHSLIRIRLWLGTGALAVSIMS